MKRHGFVISVKMVLDYQLRLNGSLHVEQEQVRIIIQKTIFLKLDGMKIIVIILRILSDRSTLITGVYLICTVTCGNGVMIGMGHIVMKVSIIPQDQK